MQLMPPDSRPASHHLAELHSSSSSTGQRALNVRVHTLCSAAAHYCLRAAKPVPCLHPSCWFLSVSGVLQTAPFRAAKAALLPCPSAEQLCRALANVCPTRSGEISASQCQGKWRGGLGCPGRCWWQCGVSEAAWLSAAHSFHEGEHPPHGSADRSCMVTVTALRD